MDTSDNKKIMKNIMLLIESMIEKVDKPNVGEKPNIPVNVPVPPGITSRFDTERDEFVKEERKSVVFSPFPYTNVEGLDFSVFVPLDTNFKKVDVSTDMLIYDYANLSDIIVQKMIEFKKNELDFTKLCKKHTINNIFIKKFIDKIDFKELSKNDKITQNDYEILREFSENFDWKDICENVIIDEYSEHNFIETFFDKVEWDSIIKNKTFNEKLIEKYENKINWKLLVDCKDLSSSFIRKNIDKLNIDTLEKAEKIFSKINFDVNLFKFTESVTNYPEYLDIREDMKIEHMFA